MMLKDEPSLFKCIEIVVSEYQCDIDLLVNLEIRGGGIEVESDYF